MTARASAGGCLAGPRTSTRGARRAVIPLLVALCALPPLLGGALYLGGWRPAQRVNHGQWVQPLRALPDVSLHGPGAAAVSVRALRGKWLLVYFAPSGCPSGCRGVVDTLRRSRQAMGLAGERLAVLIVTAGATARTVSSPVPGNHSGLMVVTAGAAADARLRAVFSAGGRGPLTGRYVYLVDPQGRLLLRYETRASPRGLIADLQRLLAYSWIG